MTALLSKINGVTPDAVIALSYASDSFLSPDRRRAGHQIAIRLSLIGPTSAPTSKPSAPV